MTSLRSRLTMFTELGDTFPWLHVRPRPREFLSSLRHFFVAASDLQDALKEPTQ